MVERQFDFELTPFGGAPVEHVKVAAINRGFAFSRAVAHASDPNNIRKAKLVRDEGRELDPHNPNESRVPPGHESFGSDRYVDRTGRLYSVDISLFGDAGAIETVDALGRVRGFTRRPLHHLRQHRLRPCQQRNTRRQNQCRLVRPGDHRDGACGGRALPSRTRRTSRQSQL